MTSPFVYEDVFGGTNLYPSDVSYGSITLTSDQVYDWPLESAAGFNNLLPRILDVTCNSYKTQSDTNVGQLSGPVSIGDTQIAINIGVTIFVGQFLTFDTGSTAPSLYVVKSISGNNVTLASPLLAAYPSGQNVYRIVFDAYSITLPPADQTGLGQVVLINARNSGAIFNIKTRPADTPKQLLAIQPGTTWQIYLTDNSTEGGAWTTQQFGASSQSYNAVNLSGSGLDVSNTQLVSAIPVRTFNVSPTYSSGNADRAQALVWTSGSGTFYLPSAPAVGNNWFLHLRNQGTGLLTVSVSGASEKLNGASSLNLSPSDSITVITDGLSNFFTLGYGRSPAGTSGLGFDYAVIDLTGQPSPFVLSGNNLNRIAYNFVGALGVNMSVVVPRTIQQYWVANNTTGNFSFTFKTSNSADPGKLITQGKRAIYYSDGNFIQEGDNSKFPTFPLAVSDGGTGASDGPTAVINLGATSIGSGVFGATNTPGAILALGGAGPILDALGFSSQGKSWISANSLPTALNLLGGPNAINAYLEVATFNDALALAVALG